MLRLFLFAAHLFCSCNARTFDTFAGDLFYGSLAATHTEWRTSFSHEPPGATGLAHVWLRCRSAVLRAFFTLESADNTTPTEGARWMTTNHLQFGDEDNKNAAFFLVVAGRKPHVHWHGYSGGFFVQNVTVGKGDAPGAVAVGVHGWARSFEFPLRRCNAPDPAVWGRRRGHLHYWNTSSLTKAPDGGGLVMGVTTWAHVDAAFVAAVARHAAYHRCLLALDKYFFITSESNFASLLLHPEIEALVEQGYLRLISAPAQPGATANAPVAWQGVIENLLLLVLWGGLWKHVLLWDPDEFAVVESPAALTSLLANATAASFKRVDAARVLAVGKAGEQSLPDVGCRFDSRWVRLHESGVVSDKVSVNPDVPAAVFVHFAEGTEPVVRVPPAVAYLLHFVNFFKRRAEAHPNGPTAGALDDAVAGLGACDVGSAATCGS